MNIKKETIMSEIMNQIKKSIENEPLFAKYFNAFEEIECRLHVEQSGDTDIEVLEIRGNTSKEDLTRFKMLKLYKSKSNQIIIVNIYLPDNMRRQGLGMKMISNIRELCNKHKSEFFIDDMVPSFHKKMLRKGAVEVHHEAVQIVDETKLFLTQS